eukprot:1864353-Rhodomonas_salina.1
MAICTGKVLFLGTLCHPLSVSFQYTINPTSDSYEYPTPQVSAGAREEGLTTVTVTLSEFLTS